MPEQSNDYNVAVFGAAGVGKSSLVLRFVKGTFRDSYVPTVEDTYRQVISCNKQVCTLQITDTTGSHQFPAMQRLSITKGHAFILVYSITSKPSLEELKPIFLEICSIKGSTDGIPIMLVGNKSDEPHPIPGAILNERMLWGSTNTENLPISSLNVFSALFRPTAVYSIVRVNPFDPGMAYGCGPLREFAANAREVNTSDGQAIAKAWKCAFMETSAKTDHNVSELFQELLQLERRRTVTLNLESKKSRSQRRREMLQGKCLQCLLM